MLCGKNREDCNLLCATLKEEGIFYYCFSSSVFYVLYMSIIVYSFDKLVSFDNEASVCFWVCCGSFGKVWSRNNSFALYSDVYKQVFVFSEAVSENDAAIAKSGSNAAQDLQLWHSQHEWRKRPNIASHCTVVWSNRWMTDYFIYLHFLIKCAVFLLDINPLWN